MSRRPRDSSSITGTTPSHDDARSSMFVEAEPLVIPKGLLAAERKRVKKIIEENAYLEQAQMDSIIRLVRLYEHFDQAEATVQKEGQTHINFRGEEKPHPSLEVLLKLQGAIVTQERNLAISVPTRNEQIAKRDRKKRAPAKTGVKSQVKSVAKKPTLRLA